MNFYHMTHAEGVSYDRVAGYKGTREPNRQDKDTVDCNGAEIQRDLRRDSNE